jgi:hypothetical protein
MKCCCAEAQLARAINREGCRLALETYLSIGKYTIVLFPHGPAHDTEPGNGRGKVICIESHILRHPEIWWEILTHLLDLQVSAG